MYAATCYGLIHRRRRRATSLFLSRTTQHLRSGAWRRESARAAVALVAVAVWGAVAMLLAG